jgi:murein DD-endopeptidase MepM/ murein hydrolase activator NlpD
VHADGVRTTYTGLLEIWVVEGMTVNQHSAIALASTGFHFGARVNDHYLDPQILIDASDVEVRARLVPAPD